MFLGTPYPALSLDLDFQVQSQAQVANVLRKLAQTTAAPVLLVGRRPCSSAGPALNKAKKVVFASAASLVSLLP